MIGNNLGSFYWWLWDTKFIPTTSWTCLLQSSSTWMKSKSCVIESGKSSRSIKNVRFQTRPKAMTSTTSSKSSCAGEAAFGLSRRSWQNHETLHKANSGASNYWKPWILVILCQRWRKKNAGNSWTSQPGFLEESDEWWWQASNPGKKGRIEICENSLETQQLEFSLSLDPKQFISS